MSEEIYTLPPVEVTATQDAPAIPLRSLAERAPDAGLSLMTAIDGALTNTYTALPGIIEAFDPATQTATVYAAILQQRLRSDEWTPELLPTLTDVPVQFPSGGGFSLTFPVAKGDECLLVFACRCIDGWWETGDFAPMAAWRMHDLSDAIAIVGIRSKPKALTDFHTAGVELRSNNGAQHIRADGAGGWHIKGNISVQGSITATGDVTGNGTHLHTHTHGGVQTGRGNTGGPN